MSIFSASTASSITQRVQAGQIAARDADRVKKTVAPGGPTRGEDEVEISVENSQSDAAVRSLTGNGQEETNDDRQQHDHFRTDSEDPSPARPRLDLQG